MNSLILLAIVHETLKLTPKGTLSILQHQNILMTKLH